MYFTRQTLIDAISILITKCYFTIGNQVFKQIRDWDSYGQRPSFTLKKSLFYFLESKCVPQLISKESTRAYKFLGTSRSIDDLCTIIHDGEFSSSYKYVYHQQLELILVHEYNKNMYISYIGYICIKAF